jgi:hypothetical protein
MDCHSILFALVYLFCPTFIHLPSLLQLIAPAALFCGRRRRRRLLQSRLSAALAYFTVQSTMRLLARNLALLLRDAQLAAAAVHAHGPLGARGPRLGPARRKFHLDVAKRLVLSSPYPDVPLSEQNYFDFLWDNIEIFPDNVALVRPNHCYDPLISDRTNVRCLIYVLECCV